MGWQDMNPLAVILVKNGSKGDELLFKYPYSSEPIKGVTVGMTDDSKVNPYFTVIEKDVPIEAKHIPSTSNIKNGKLTGFPDKVMSNLFSVKSELCGQKFELKVNDVRFIGHPTKLCDDSLVTSQHSHKATQRRKSSTIVLFNIVFALRANLSHDIVSCYHDLSRMICKALVHEERRKNYLSKEAKKMLAAHDEAPQLTEDTQRSPFDIILEESLIAQNLKQAYDSLCTSGIVDININKWINISFCLPQKINENLSIGSNISNRTIILNGIKKLKPYHTLLLLEDNSDLLNQLKPDTSPALRRLLQVALPTKPLYVLAVNADLTLNQVFQLSIHLMYWGKATIIYPLCITNTYVCSPLSHHIGINHRLSIEFNKKFHDHSLHATLSEFSLPISLRDKCDPVKSSHEQIVQQVLWLLKYDLLQQLHTYVYLAPPPSSVSHASYPTSNDTLLNLVQKSINSRNHSHSGSEVSSMSVCSEERSPSPGGIMSNIDKDASNLLTQHLTQQEIAQVMKNETSYSTEDIKVFAKLCQYFRGKYHLEDIMYMANVTRSQLLEILDKFSEVLITCRHSEDAQVKDKLQGILYCN